MVEDPFVRLHDLFGPHPALGFDDSSRGNSDGRQYAQWMRPSNPQHYLLGGRRLGGPSSRHGPINRDRGIEDHPEGASRQQLEEGVEHGYPYHFHPPPGYQGPMGPLNNDAAAASGAVRRLQQGRTTQKDAPWHLERINNRDKREDNYVYTQSGAGVDIYILDSGINAGHQEFTGRVQPGQNFSPDKAPNDVTDCNGHGTHVAALAAGTTFGAAKSANIIPVRVYDCSSEVSSIASCNCVCSLSFLRV